MGELRFNEVVNDSAMLMGVKAVYGRSILSLIAFGPRGDLEREPSKHFMLGRNTAEVALQTPYLISIGGGAQVTDELRGRALELLRVTGVYGKTSDFIPDEATRKRMAQWPVATLLTEVYTIDGEPRLVEDLGFPDRRILENAYDTVRRDPAAIAKLWEALKERSITRRYDIAPPPGFIDRGKLVYVGSRYPQITAAEGERIHKSMVEVERKSAISKAKKLANKSDNGGQFVCEGCGFSDESSAMFDVHHLSPISIGPRETSMDDLAVLCPTCHRWSHAKGIDRLTPLPVAEVSAQRGASRRM